MGVRRLLQSRRSQLSAAAAHAGYRRICIDFCDVAARRARLSPDDAIRASSSTPVQCRPAVRGQAEGAVRRSELQVRSVQADRRRPLVRLPGNTRLHLWRYLLERRHKDRRQDQVERLLARAESLSWEPNRNLSVNLQVAKGFRLGGINDPLNIPLCSAEDQAIYGPFASATYNDETLWNYEAGFKYSKARHHLQCGRLPQPDQEPSGTVDAGSCSSRLVFNVPKAHSNGIEAEFSVHPLAGLDLSFAGSLLNSKFDSTIANPFWRSDRHRKGNRLPTVPKYQFAATANYDRRSARLATGT